MLGSDSARFDGEFGSGRQGATRKEKGVLATSRRQKPIELISLHAFCTPPNRGQLTEPKPSRCLIPQDGTTAPC
jgi:hypothetical protein